MRIAYLCADFGIPVLGYKGASVHVREVIRALVADGHEVLAICAKMGEGNAFPDGACAVEIPPVKLPGARQAERTLESRELDELVYNSTLDERSKDLLDRFRPEVVYERYSLFGFGGLGIARRLGVPHLLEVNAPLRLERARTKGLRLDRTAGEIELRVFSGSDCVFAVSGPLQRYLFDRGAAPARCFVLPNGVDTARFGLARSSKAVRERYGLEEDAIVVGFAGSLKPWHGTDLLIEAFAELRAARPKVRLLIVGEGPEEDALKAQAKHLGLEGAVVFTGRVDHEAMPDYLAALDIAVAPYRDLSGFYFSPLKLYEYMAARLAVVASDAGEIGELVNDGVNGLLFAPGDEPQLSARLLRLVDDEALRRTLGEVAREEAERHSWTANARAIVDHAA
jgi:glycosyltransferase involved in cell wall biosynthesis